MGGIVLDKAILISMILEDLLYGGWPKSSISGSITDKLGSGIFTVMFGFTLWVIIHERRGRINMRLLVPALALYALATAVSHLIEYMPRIIHFMLDCFKHLTVNVYQGVKAFTTYRDTPTGVSSPSNLLRSSLYVVQTLLGDLCLVRKYCCYTITRRSVVHDTISQIYRCSVVWQHNIWIIILPILLWISCAGKYIMSPQQTITNLSEFSNWSWHHYIL